MPPRKRVRRTGGYDCRREPTLQMKLLQVCLKGERENSGERGPTGTYDSCWTEEREGERNSKEKAETRKSGL